MDVYTKFDCNPVNSLDISVWTKVVDQDQEADCYYNMRKIGVAPLKGLRRTFVLCQTPFLNFCELLLLFDSGAVQQQLQQIVHRLM